MPIVDDPFDFGAIAATNAISDVYAMGGTPLFALALVGMPINSLPLETIRKVLEGGESVCAKAGIPIAGGHTIDSVEPIYGLVAIGLVDPGEPQAQCRRAARRPPDPRQAARRRRLQRGAQEGEAVGAEGYAAMIASDHAAQHAGHRAGQAARRPRADRRHRLRPARPPARDLPRRRAGALDRLRRGAAASRCRSNSRAKASSPAPRDATGPATATTCDLGAGIGEAERALLTDPQTSGGLLVACAPRGRGRSARDLPQRRVRRCRGDRRHHGRRAAGHRALTHRSSAARPRAERRRTAARCRVNDSAEPSRRRTP